DAVLQPKPELGGAGLRLAVRTLERIGTEKSVPGLTALSKNLPSASWALVEIAGAAAEPALLEAMPRWRASRLDYLVNLDRVGSTNCGPHLPILLQAFGLVIYRSRTDDLQFQPTAFQRAAGNLILRTGRAQQVVDLILAECEGTRREEETPPELRAILANMKKELAPGFVRSDGTTVAQPLAALPHIITDRRFIPRLIALLEHPAYIVRIYSAEGLAALEAEEAVEPILNVLRTPYPFPDPTSQASGKHFDRSRFVRWRGYVAIALGKLGGEAARQGLETLAADPASYRDIRYGSVVGLRFLGSAKSLSVLEQVAAEDIIREVRMEALAAVEEIQLAEQLASSPLAGK
ncbi:MAG: HEAT repeat domain-containing protein, partial [Planctomycetes bacterium]|nr:HEAT repeat domain-containing protein [Planctomycetota bacterium]